MANVPGGCHVAVGPAAIPMDVAAGQRQLDASCSAIGVATLERVPPYSRGYAAPVLSSEYGNESIEWASGHFPWWRASLRCNAAPANATVTPSSLALLMTVDSHYAELVPAWAAEASHEEEMMIL